MKNKNVYEVLLFLSDLLLYTHFILGGMLILYGVFMLFAIFNFIPMVLGLLVILFGYIGAYVLKGFSIIVYKYEME